MKIINETSLRDFKVWGGAVETKERIIKEGKEEKFEELIDLLYPEGVVADDLNDYLSLDSKEIYFMLGI